MKKYNFRVSDEEKELLLSGRTCTLGYSREMYHDSTGYYIQNKSNFDSSLVCMSFNAPSLPTVYDRLPNEEAYLAEYKKIKDHYFDNYVLTSGETAKIRLCASNHSGKDPKVYEEEVVVK